MTNEFIYDIMKKYNESIDENNLYFLTGKYFSFDEVINNEEILNKKYKHLYKPNGFNNFYDMVLFCKSNTEKVTKGGDKDLSNLNKVKRKVIRNGKEVEMTIYEDGNSKDKEQQDKQPETNTNSAIGSSVEDNGGINEKVNPEKLATSLSILKNKGVDTSHLKETSSIYKVFNNGEDVIGIAEYNLYDKEIKLESYISSPESSGVGLRSIFELIKLGIDNEMAISIYDIQLKEAIHYIEYLGFKKVKDRYLMSKKEVQNFLGDNDVFI